MKKIIILVALTLSIYGCQKKNETVNKLQGKWKATKFVDLIYPQLNLLDESIEFKYIFNECGLIDCPFITSFYYLGNENSKNGVYQISSNEDSLHLIYNETTNHYKINELTSDHLSINNDDYLYEFVKL